jgi:hypothetical protein
MYKIKISKLLISNKCILMIYHFFLYKLIPSKINIKRRFKKTFGYNLNLKDPQTFNEKLQWKKFYDHNTLYTQCSDKFAVREYVKNKIGEEFLIPLLFITEDPLEIPFNKLKPPYIIKSNHGSSRNLFVYDREDINKKKITEECASWLKENYYYYGKEWQYKNIKPKIIIEKLLLTKENNIPNDYKFHCFKGKVEFIQVDSDRFGNHKRTLFDINWNKMPFIYSPKMKNQNLPKYQEDFLIQDLVTLNKMVDTAQNLSAEFDYVRVDLYLLNEKIYFGELTFTPGSGFECFFPEKYDLIYGNKIKLQNNE